MSRYEIDLLESLAAMERGLAESVEERSLERAEDTAAFGEMRLVLFGLAGVALVAAAAASMWACGRLRKVSSRNTVNKRVSS